MAARGTGGRAGPGVRVGRGGGLGDGRVGTGHSARARASAGWPLGAAGARRARTAKDDLRERDEPRDDLWPDGVPLRCAGFLALGLTLGRVIGYAIPLGLTLALARGINARSISVRGGSGSSSRPNPPNVLEGD